MARFLRPDRIVRGADATWLVDEVWPVAAKLGAGAVTVVAWPWPDGAPEDAAGPGADRVVVADGVGLVTKVDDQVVWVRRAGCTFARVEADLLLAAADPEVAWFIDNTPLDPGAPPSAAPPLPPGRIVTVRPDGSAQQVMTPAPVTAVGLRDADVWITLAELPVARPGSSRESWWFTYPSSVVRVTRDRLLVDGWTPLYPLSVTSPGAVRRARRRGWLTNPSGYCDTRVGADLRLPERLTAGPVLPVTSPGSRSTVVATAGHFEADHSDLRPNRLRRRLVQ